MYVHSFFFIKKKKRKKGPYVLSNFGRIGPEIVISYLHLVFSHVVKFPSTYSACLIIQPMGA